MRGEYRPALRDFGIGSALFFLSILPLKKVLLTFRFSNPDIDFLYVLLILLLPSIFRFLSLTFFTKGAIYLLKLIFLPRWMMEREIYRLVKRSWFKSLFYSSILFLFFLFPFRANHIFMELIDNMRRALPFYFFPLYFPLYFISYMDIGIFFQSVVVGGFLLHLLKVAGAKRAWIGFHGKKIFEAGRDVSFEIELGGFMVPIPQLPFNLKQRIHSDFFKRRVRIEVEGKLPVGYYRFDLLRFVIATFPFFFSTVYRVSNDEIEITVLPKIKMKNYVYPKNPYLVRETGELIKKVSGSSLEFAGIREFQLGDPLSRVWWKSLAKGGKLLSKDFYAPAEDRWILVVDLSAPEIEERERDALLTFVRTFVEIFTRKDVEISIHMITPYYSFIDYSTKKRDLISFITKHLREFQHMSYKGARKVLEDAVDGEVDVMERRSKRGGISLQAMLFYSGVIRRPRKLFYWSRKAAVSDGVAEMVKSVRKSGKIVVVTPKMEKELADMFKRIAISRKCPLIFASFERVPHHRTYLISRENPERSVWRLMYA